VNFKDNELLIISHIPINQTLINTLKIIPYPDQNGYQFDYSDHESYFKNKNKIFNQKNEEINNDCITNIQFAISFEYPQKK